METLTSDNDQQLKYSSWQLVRDMYRFVKPYKGSFIVATTLRILCDLAWLYPPIALAQTVTFLTAYKPGVLLAPLSTIFIFFALATCVRFGGGYLVKMTMFRTSERSALDAQMATILHLFSVDISWHEKENTGNKLKKITRGADSIDRLLRIWINNLIPIIVNFFGITYIIIRFNTKVALITLTFLFMYFILSRIFRVRASRASIISNKQEEVLEGVLFESLNNIRTVKVLGMAPALSKTLLRESNDYYQKILQRLFWNQTSGYTRSFFANVFKLCLMAFIVFGITKGWYTVSFLIIFYGYFGFLVDSVGELADISQDYIVAKISVSRMFEVLTVPVGIDSAEGKVSFPSEWKKISFQNVSFGYGENQVLHDISFDIMRGQKVGIIGLSGAGKSTIFKLLLKEHESYTGEILIDGVPLRDISKHDYFNYSAVVLQDTEVFNFSLKENITLANASEANNEELFSRAVRVAHVDDFISRLPLGTETLIGEKGVRLSGGERQRVGIARAVFKSPQLLLLDEATSHLDIESEEKIRESLHEFFTTVTAVVIAHRLTTIKEMDRIIVIEDGKILEEGSFDELYAKKGGRFQELWNKQSL